MEPAPLDRFLQPGWQDRARPDPRGFTSLLAQPDAGEGGRFGGSYGAAYDTVMRHRPLRLAAGLMWGRHTILPRLEELLDRALGTLPAGSAVLDVPCGGGTMLPLIAARAAGATVVGCDLSGAMLERAVHRWTTDARRLDVLLVQCDALDLPFADGVFDVALSVNGLHCMPDPGRYLAELRRVLRPGATLWVTTMVTDRSWRHRAIMDAARRGAIIPQAAPTLGELHELAGAAGFSRTDELGGEGVVGLRLEA